MQIRITQQDDKIKVESKTGGLTYKNEGNLDAVGTISKMAELLGVNLNGTPTLKTDDELFGIDTERLDKLVTHLINKGIDESIAGDMARTILIMHPEGGNIRVSGDNVMVY